MSHKPHAVALAVSYREAARLLRIDRGDTLHDLIRRHVLRPVPWGKAQRIPLEQVQELARTGFTVSSTRSRGPSCGSHRVPTSDVEARIRALKVRR